jgi:hypothetical protein
LENSDNTFGCYLFFYELSQLPSVDHNSCCWLRYWKVRLGYEKCLLFSVVRFNIIDVSHEVSEQELSKPTPPDMVNKAKTVTTADNQKNQNSCTLWEIIWFVYEMVQEKRDCKNFWNVILVVQRAVSTITLIMQPFAALIVCKHKFHIVFAVKV